MSGVNRTGIVAMLVAAELFIVAFGIYSLRGRGMAFANTGGGHVNSFTARSIAPIAAGPAPTVSIDDPNSGVRVSVSHDGLVHVSDETSFSGGWFGSDHGAYPQLQVTHDFNGVHISRASYDADWFIGDSTQEIDVQIPAASQLTIANGGSIEIDGLNGGNVVAHSTDGEIDATDITTPMLELSSNDGHIEAARVAMTGTSAQAKIQTNDGHVTVSGLFPAGGNYNISTNDGSVQVDVARGSDVTVDASTNDGDLNVDDARQNRDGDDSASQTVRVGSGASAMKVHSDDGSVAVTTNGAN